MQTNSKEITNYLVDKSLNQTISNYHKLIKLEKNNYNLYLQLAYLYEIKGNIDQAIENYEKCLQCVDLDLVGIVELIKKIYTRICLLDRKNHWQTIRDNLLKQSKAWQYIKSEIFKDYPSINLEEYLILVLFPSNVGDSTGFLSLLKSLNHKIGKKIILFVKDKPHLQDLYKLFKGEHIFACYSLKLNNNYCLADLIIQPINPGIPAAIHLLASTIPEQNCSDFKRTGIHFNLYQRNLGLQSDAKIEYPQINNSDKEKAIAKFIDLKLKPGKTVLVAPLSNTANKKFLTNEKFKKFWNDVYYWLDKQGFSIAVNGINQDQKIEMENDKLQIVHIPLKEIITFTEYAGFFIGIRSGLCDLLSFARCKKKIIYPLNFNGGNLRNFGYQDYIVDHNDYDIDTILRNWI